MRGYTLIELLVTFAIVWIFVTIILSTLGAVREQAKVEQVQQTSRW